MEFACLLAERAAATALAGKLYYPKAVLNFGAGAASNLNTYRIASQVTEDQLKFIECSLRDAGKQKLRSS